MLTTTFRRAREAGACLSSYCMFAKFKGGIAKWGNNTPFPLSEVLEVCGLNDAIWALRIVIEPAEKEIRLFACDCAERVLPIYEKQYPDDQRPRQAIETARRFAIGKATPEELHAAGATAGATAAALAASAAALAASAAGAAACAALAANAAGAAACAALAAGAAEREWQKERFIKLLDGVVTVPLQG